MLRLKTPTNNKSINGIQIFDNKSVARLSVPCREPWNTDYVYLSLSKFWEGAEGEWMMTNDYSSDSFPFDIVTSKS